MDIHVFISLDILGYYGYCGNSSMAGDGRGTDPCRLDVCFPYSLLISHPLREKVYATHLVNLSCTLHTTPPCTIPHPSQMQRSSEERDEYFWVLKGAEDGKLLNVEAWLAPTKALPNRLQAVRYPFRLYTFCTPSRALARTPAPSPPTPPPRPTPPARTSSNAIYKTRWSSHPSPRRRSS
jgi:hypothetical protein